jgi:hypothetical protein
VLAVAAVLVALQLGFRAWALLGGWFYVDDFRLLYDGSTSQLSLAYLVRPYDSQLMPWGRLVAWSVAQAGPLSWTTVVLVSLALQTAASAACLWMLVTLFGLRWGILPPLCVYLFSVMTMPALLWWAAGLNQLVPQLVTFAAVALWVRYLRAPAPRSLALVVLVVLVGLLAYVKALLLLPLLAAVQLLYFTDGPLRNRVRQLCSGWRAAGVAALALTGVAYLAYYLTSVPQLFTGSSWGTAASLLRTMVGVSFVTAAVGGPWHWRSPNPPTSLADPPGWTVLLAWLTCLAVVAASVLLRRRAGRAWLLLGGYLLAVWLLAATSRAPVVGPDVIGLEYRYLTDTTAVLCLVLGLAFLDLPGAPGSSVARAVPVAARWTWPRRSRPSVVAGLTAAVAVGGLFSSRQHALTWQDDNAASDYMHAAMADLRLLDRRVPLADHVVPAAVMPGWLYPYNTSRRMLHLVPQPTSFPDTSAELFTLDEEGRVRSALIDIDVASLPGPEPGCGWRVESAGGSVPMAGPVVDLSPWVRVAYLASAPSPLTVRFGATSYQTTVRPGAQSLFLRNPTTFDRIGFSGLDPGVTMCVERIEAGEAVPGLTR